jgi:hypothetical protein
MAQVLASQLSSRAYKLVAGTPRLKVSQRPACGPRRGAPCLALAEGGDDRRRSQGVVYTYKGAYKLVGSHSYILTGLAHGAQACGSPAHRITFQHYSQDLCPENFVALRIDRA